MILTADKYPFIEYIVKLLKKTLKKKKSQHFLNWGKTFIKPIWKSNVHVQTVFIQFI